MKKTNPIPEHAKMVFKGKIFEVWQWEQKMFDGSIATFERLRRPNTAQVIAVVGDKILLQEQQQPDSKPFISTPGGRCDWGEDPLEAAKRELLEETGYVSDDWEKFREVYPVSKIEWTVYTYVARDCRKEKEPELDGGEKIQTRLATFDEFLELAENPIYYDSELKPMMMLTRCDEKKKRELHMLLFKK